MLLNEKIRKLRELNNLSQEEMAAKLGMSTTGYAKIERGERRLDIPKLEEITEALGMDLLSLIHFDAEKVSSLVKDSTQNIIYHQVNQDSPQNTYFNGTEKLASEIEKLHLMLAHKNELLAQKEREFNQMLEQKSREIALLQDLINVLKQNHQ